MRITWVINVSNAEPIVIVRSQKCVVPIVGNLINVASVWPRATGCKNDAMSEIAVIWITNDSSSLDLIGDGAD